MASSTGGPKKTPHVSERNAVGAENHMQPGRKKRRKGFVPDEKMAVYIVAPTILGNRIYKGYAKRISSPADNKIDQMQVNIVGLFELHDLAILRDLG